MIASRTQAETTADTSAALAPSGVAGQRARTWVERQEIALFEALRPWVKHPLFKAAGALGDIGDEPPVLVASGVTFALGLLRKDARLARAGAGMIAAHVAAIAIKNFGKNRVDRTRPTELLDKGKYRMEFGTSPEPERQSFPSGHAAGAFAVAGAAAREYPAARVVLGGAAGLIGVLQIPRRAHFPTDIVAGAVVGIVAEALTAAVWRKLAGMRS